MNTLGFLSIIFIGIIIIALLYNTLTSYNQIFLEDILFNLDNLGNYICTYIITILSIITIYLNLRGFIYYNNSDYKNRSIINYDKTKTMYVTTEQIFFWKKENVETFIVPPDSYIYVNHCKIIEKHY